MAKNKYAEMFTRRADGRYVATYTDKDGRHYVYDKDPGRLKQKLDKINDPQPPIFAEIADYWKSTAYPKLEDGTISCYNPAYKRAVEYVGEELATDITPETIKRQLEQMNKQNYSAKTIKTQRTIYRLIFAAAIENDKYYRFIKLNPADQVKLPKGMKPPVEREAPPDKIVEEIRRTAATSYFGWYALYLMSTGYRRGESFGVQIKDIDLDAGKNGEIFCYKQVTHRGMTKIKPPKTDAGIRHNPILPDIKPWLELQVRTRDPEEFLICGENPKKPIAKSTFERRWMHYCKDHGFVIDRPEQKVSKQGKKYIVHHYTKTLTPHIMRHGYATLLFEADVDVYTAQKLIGHKDISTTQAIYTHLRDKKKESSEQKLIDYVKPLYNAADDAAIS